MRLPKRDDRSGYIQALDDSAWLSQIFGQLDVFFCHIEILSTTDVVKLDDSKVILSILIFEHSIFV